MFRNVVDASFKINSALLNSESELKNESKRKYYIEIFGLVLFLILAVMSVVYLLFYKKQKSKYLFRKQSDAFYKKQTELL